MITHLKFEEKIETNNGKLGIVTSKNLSEFNKLNIPNEQRIRDDDKVNDILHLQLEYKKNGNFNFLGVINIHHLIPDDEYYLVDGQHRYKAIKQLYMDHGHGDFLIKVEMIKVNSREELKENYRLINKNTPLPEFPDAIDKNIPEKAAKHYKDNYSNMWSKNARARRPHIYFNHFQEALGFLTKKLHIESAEELVKIVNEHNENIAHWEHEKVSKNILEKCEKMKFYLGVYNHVSDEWGYKWVKDIIYDKTGEKIKGQTKKKHKIPKAIKTQSWDTHIGADKGEVMCICCMHNKIKQSNFHAGHIQAEAEGGAATVDNIMPICSQCNLSMQTKHMRNYVEEHHPSQNLSFFDKKKFFTPDEWEEHNNPKQSGGFLGMGNIFKKEKKKRLVIRK